MRWISKRLKPLLETLLAIHARLDRSREHPNFA
jgi:hypothetical protein